MNDHIHLFATEAEFTSAYTNDYAEPWVSYCMETSGLSYNKGTTPPPTPSHDYIEIGGIKWATMNLGATAVTDYGKYYAWGETTGYTASQVGTDKNFTWADYELCDGTSSNMTKYNDIDGLTTLQTTDDAVASELGGNWRMPTTDEFQELGDNVNATWTSNYQGSGVAGIVCTDKTDSTKVLFFPAAGGCEDGSHYGSNSYGFYWSNSLNSDFDVSYGYGLYGVDDGAYWTGTQLRKGGYSIRGILDE